MNNKTTIHSLRRQGYKVAVMHKPGQMTHIIITDTEKNTAEGYSFVAPGDRYNRKLGNTIALGRALKNLELGEFCAWVPPAVEL